MIERELIEAILARYHQTRLAGDAVDFILSDERVQAALWAYACKMQPGAGS